LDPISQDEFDLCCGRVPKSAKPKAPKKPKDIAGVYTGRTGLKVIINTDIPTEKTEKAKRKSSKLEAYEARMAALKGES
jgi:hypothetical protein